MKAFSRFEYKFVRVKFETYLAIVLIVSIFKPRGTPFCLTSTFLEKEQMIVLI